MKPMMEGEVRTRLLARGDTACSGAWSACRQGGIGGGEIVQPIFTMPSRARVETTILAGLPVNRTWWPVQGAAGAPRR
jgi:hypothetical protein